MFGCKKSRGRKQEYDPEPPLIPSLGKDWNKKVILDHLLKHESLSQEVTSKIHTSAHGNLTNPEGQGIIKE